MKTKRFRTRWDEQYIRTRIESGGPRSDDPRFKGFFKPMPQAPYSWLWWGNTGYRLRTVDGAAYMTLVCELRFEKHANEEDIRVSVHTREALMWGLGIWGFVGAIVMVLLLMAVIVPGIANGAQADNLLFFMPLGLLLMLFGGRFGNRRRLFEALLIEHLGLVPDALSSNKKA